MLTKSLKSYIEEEMHDNKIALFSDERIFASETGILSEEITVETLDDTVRFHDSLIERVNKETEELIQTEETPQFLETPVNFVKRNLNEFLFIDSKWFEIIRIDGLTLEVDDVFGHYSVLTGLKVQKKMANDLKAALSEKLHGEDKVQLMWNDKDGLFDLNLSIDKLEGFNENESLGKNLQLIYHFLFTVLKELESK
ncbi:branched-chain amino acid aminotransferase [Rossellomorea vietnamensis]|uniref:Branched-chain amino acid aminotransferase n=1 Tax=Rossellomorea vietnamensis TaxID=218284 RepID=A0A5D4KDX6_9BACI|nr:branched-chain amino acid aminotransferase [Rossellomorea vietnamensis]TYR75096.1 branched-chain amino acid aminotransferase [Rossellomorea vietnamensis]